MTRSHRHVVLFGAAAITALSLAACSKKVETVQATPAAAPAAATPGAPAPAAANAEMQKVLDKLASLGGKPIESLEPAEARKQPTPADAVKGVMADMSLSTAPDPAVTTQDTTYPAGQGTQKARIYKPAGAKGPLPVVLYIHGGGWVIADIDVYDASPRALAKAANAIVVSIEYRHAPEAKFPAAHDDANAAWRWVLANAAKWGGDPKKVAVVGESAGGNMAVNVAIAARDAKLQAPTAVVAVYPVANTSPDTASKRAYVAAKPLNTPMLDWFFKYTLADPGQAQDPRLNLVGARLDGLPPTTIILAQIDPLHDDGAGLADRLKAAGVTVDVKDYAGVTHEFFGMGAVVPAAKEAEDYAAAKLKQSFGQ
jgi:acetyl esterase/lipase